MSAYECPKCFNWVESPNHICYAGDPDRRGRAEQQARVQRVLDEARAAVKVGGWYAPLAEAVLALGAPRERWHVYPEPGGCKHSVSSDAFTVAYCPTKQDAELVAAALNAQERKP